MEITVYERMGYNSVEKERAEKEKERAEKAEKRIKELEAMLAVK